MHFANILVGTDGTALMEAVFDECAYLARLTGATIHVAYVLDITGFGAQPVDGMWEETYVIIKSEARRILEVAREALVKRRVAEASITEILLEGDPTEEISAYVKDHAIDLIVIGTHGRKGLDRLLIGNLTTRSSGQPRFRHSSFTGRNVGYVGPNWQDLFASSNFARLKYPM